MEELLVAGRACESGSVDVDKQVVMDVVKRLEGAWGLLIKSSHYPGEMVACKRGSPLILGLKEAPDWRPASSSPQKRRARQTLEAFIASDASAMVEHTKK